MPNKDRIRVEMEFISPLTIRKALDKFLDVNV